jgi:hypothetical protein
MIRKNIFYNLTLKKNIKSQLTNHEHRFFSTKKKAVNECEMGGRHSQPIHGRDKSSFVFCQNPNRKI